MDGYRSLAGSAQYPNKNTFWPTRFQPCFAISISSQRVGVVVGESIKPVIVDLIKDLHIATAILGLDRIRMPSVEPHSSMPRTTFHIVAHKEQVHKRYWCALAHPTTELVIGALPHRHRRPRAANQAPWPALSVGFGSCRQWPFAVGANFSLSDLQGSALQRQTGRLVRALARWTDDVCATDRKGKG